jgi:hypothetical protein
VSAVNLLGDQLGDAASSVRAPGLKVDPVNGVTTISTLRITDVANLSSTSCPRLVAAGLRVYPPNEKAIKIVPFPFSACGKVGETFLQVSALQLDKCKRARRWRRWVKQNPGRSPASPGWSKLLEFWELWATVGALAPDPPLVRTTGCAPG